MNKSELVESISNISGLSKGDSEKALQGVIETIITHVKDGIKVSLPGLGTFEKNFRNARMGLNPSNGQKISISARNIPKFKAAKYFKETIA